MNQASGINEERLDSLVLDIYDYAEKVNQILNSIDELIIKSNTYFKCESADKVRTHYQELDSSSTMLKQNMLNCANDLARVKYRYQEMNDDIKKIALQGMNKIDI